MADNEAMYADTAYTQKDPYVCEGSGVWATRVCELQTRYGGWVPTIVFCVLLCGLLLHLSWVSVWDAGEWETDVESLVVVEQKLLVRLTSNTTACISTADIASPIAGIALAGEPSVLWKPTLHYADPNQFQVIRWKNSSLCLPGHSAELKASAAIELAYHDKTHAPHQRRIDNLRLAYCVQHALLVLANATVKCG